MLVLAVVLALSPLSRAFSASEDFGVERFVRPSM